MTPLELSSLHCPTCSLVLMSGFVFVLLRPFLDEIINETRRIAELLSQLPAEVGSFTGRPIAPHLHMTDARAS
jgi:hypothetical protein